MGNKTKYTLGGRGTINIQRESGKRNNVKDVIHVPSLGMNLIPA